MSEKVFIKLLICTVFIVVLLNSFCVSSSYALDEIFTSGKGFLGNGNSIGNAINTTELEKTSDFIYNILLAIGIMVAVIVAMILGIQFMAASADEKAKVKEAILPFVVGCFVVFGSFTIWKVAVNIGNNAENKVWHRDFDDNPYNDSNVSYDVFMNVSTYDIECCMTESELKSYEEGAKKVMNKLNRKDSDEEFIYQNLAFKLASCVMARRRENYKSWFDYRGTKEEHEAFTELINMDINTIKNLTELRKIKNIATNGQNYYKAYIIEYGKITNEEYDTSKLGYVKGINRLLNNLDARERDLITAAAAGIREENIKDTELVE